MPMAVRYTTVEGQVLCENRGGVKTLFMPDTLGNVIETRNMDTGAQTSSTTYWPYGEVRTQTGTNPSPFGFCGVCGYYTQAGQPTYVRARYYRPNLGRWQTVDPLWPQEDTYTYSHCLPVGLADPSGLQVGPLPTCLQCAQQTVGPAIEAANRFCRENGIGGSAGSSVCNAMQHCMWSCLIAQQCRPLGYQWWECAKFVTDSHEEDGPCPPYRTNPGLNPPDQKCMDLYNNRIGMNCASATSCYTCCSLNIKSGNCQYIDPSPGYPPRGWRPCKTGCKSNSGAVRLPPIQY